MTGDVKLLLAASALVLVAGLGFMMFGPKPKPVPAVLGYVDPGPPRPEATPDSQAAVQTAVVEIAARWPGVRSYPR